MNYCHCLYNLCHRNWLRWLEGKDRIKKSRKMGRMLAERMSVERWCRGVARRKHSPTRWDEKSEKVKML